MELLEGKNITQELCENQDGHPGCMSVEEAGAGERGRECESEIYIYIFLLRFILLLF